MDDLKLFFSNPSSSKADNCALSSTTHPLFWIYALELGFKKEPFEKGAGLFDDKREPLEHKKVLHLMRCSLASLECFIKGKEGK